MEEFIIPIDDAIKGFFEHLKVNKRTILSSRFGDGKSFFLKSFKQDKCVKEKFTFLTIYPVNYQVTSNQDIFALIKRDILFQLLINGMIDEEFEVPKDIVLWFYLQSKGESLISDLIHFLSAVAIPELEKVKVLVGMKTLELFKNLKSDFNELKNKSNQGEIVDKFIGIVNTSTIYEDDIITFIIKKSIERYRKKEGKEVVLIVEDMDRIDPAHLFRILNIFSAHIDYCYKDFIKPDNSLAGNKFNLDNIVLVCDYLNVEKIFKHFYGVDTDFHGYIGKFLSSLPYSYSLQDERKNYVYNMISTVTKCPVDFLKYIIEINEYDIENKTLREIMHAIELERNMHYRVPLTIDDGEIVLCPIMLSVLSVIKRLGFSVDSMKDHAETLFLENTNYFISYIAPYKLLLNRNKTLEDKLYYYNVENWCMIQCFSVNNKGVGLKGECYQIMPEMERTDFSAIITCMLGKIVS